jgi:hypothetical protein
MHESNQGLLFLGSQLQTQDKVEEFHGVFKG